MRTSQKTGSFLLHLEKGESSFLAGEEGIYKMERKDGMNDI